ncbi:MAG TPA: hypothetical protein VF720_07870 [Candidatus Eisenbacteria bacterium]
MTQTRRLFSDRPWLAPLVAAAAVVAMLVVPFSYQKTTAYDVVFHLDGAAPAVTASLSSALQQSLSPESVNSNSPGDGTVTLTARVPVEKAAGLAVHAASFANVLAARGLSVTHEVVPVRETVSGNLYAMTTSGAVRVDITTTGRTPEEMEADVRRQLEAAGIANAEVTINKDGTQTTIQVMAHQDENSGEAHEPRDFNFTFDGQAPDPSKTAQIRIDNSGHTMSDAQIKETIESQLASQGHPATVVVSGGKIVSVTPIRN